MTIVILRMLRPTSELFLQRKVRTRFDLLYPDLKSRIVSKQEDQKRQHDRHSRVRNLLPGEAVMVRDFRHKNEWIPGIIVNKIGPVSYSIRTNCGTVVRRHVDHVTKRCSDSALHSKQPNSDMTRLESVRNSPQPYPYSRTVSLYLPTLH